MYEEMLDNAPQNSFKPKGAPCFFVSLQAKKSSAGQMFRLRRKQK